MEQVLFNIDLFTYIIGFIPNIYCLHFNSICKNINEILSFKKCNLCYNKLFLPIEVDDKLYCYNCYNLEFIKVNGIKFNINRSDLKAWKYLDTCRIKPYISCKFCKLKCSTLDFAHYHLLYKCKCYSPNILTNIV